MARFTDVVESAAALPAGQVFANLVAGAAANFKLRRVKPSFRLTGSVVDMQITLQLFRATARGTQSATKTPQAEDPRSAASAITGLDTAWTVAPTLAANPIDELSLNTRSLVIDVWELPDELTCDQGTGNGFAFQIVGNALPAGYQLVLAMAHDE